MKRIEGSLVPDQCHTCRPILVYILITKAICVISIHSLLIFSTNSSSNVNAVSYALYAGLRTQSHSNNRHLQYMYRPILVIVPS